MSQQRSGDAVEFTCTQVEPNRYVLVHRGEMDAPLSHVWALLYDFQRFVGVLLPTVPFEWLDGGGVSKVPSRYQLTVGDTRLVEELDYRDERDHTLRYHLITPGLGMVAYEAEVKLTQAGEGRTRVDYQRDFTMQPGAGVDALTQLSHQEFADMRKHFAKRA
ncbi:MAG TPA: SRPBCC family protein [Myxococcaceae bacterium]|nr:SRPBCC family protein [Myxococcaceae bacterium]